MYGWFEVQMIAFSAVTLDFSLLDIRRLPIWSHYNPHLRLSFLGCLSDIKLGCRSNWGLCNHLWYLLKIVGDLRGQLINSLFITEGAFVTSNRVTEVPFWALKFLSHCLVNFLYLQILLKFHLYLKIIHYKVHLT